MKSFRHIPLKTMGLLFVAWVGLFFFNFWLLRGLNLKTGTTWLFPLTQFIGPRFHPSSLPYALAFLVVLGLGIKWRERMSAGGFFCMGVVLVFLGNLVQGDWVSAFHHPFTAHDMQYYSDALKIQEPLTWLASFNTMQPELLIHSKTHPPFAVLIHYPFMTMGKWSLSAMAILFTSVSCLSLLFIGDAVRTAGNSQWRSYMLLFAVLPAVNIYSGVSLDGLIAMCAAASVAGMARLSQGERDIVGILFFSCGLVGMNLLTFGGSFLLLTSLLAGIASYRMGNPILLRVLAGNSFIGLLGLALFHWGFGYNHLQAFLTASHLENPNGFLAIHAPLVYIMTRMADITEIALFFSPAALAYLCHQIRKPIGSGLHIITWAGIATLGLMFLTGAFRVGETARACLFIYPFLILPLSNLTKKQFNFVLWTSGLSTVIMQTIGGYVW